MTDPIKRDDAPERIWTASTNGKCHVGFDTPSLDYKNEYVRADLADPAAIREAARLDAGYDTIAAARWSAPYMTDQIVDRESIDAFTETNPLPVDPAAIREAALQTRIEKALDEREQALNACEKTLDERDEALAKLTKAVEALREIAGRHIPSQPATDGGDEIDWCHRQYASLRGIARAMLAELEGKE